MQELELVFDATNIAKEHQSTLLGEQIVRDVFLTGDRSPEWDATTQDHACEIVVGFAEIADAIAGIYLSDMGKMRADRGKKVRFRRRVPVARIPRQSDEVRGLRVVVENEVIIGKFVVPRSGSSPFGTRISGAPLGHRPTSIAANRAGGIPTVLAVRMTNFQKAPTS